MIDEEKVKERIETMNKQNFQNLLMAMSVDKYLFDIFGNFLTTAYSPDVSTMMVRYKDPRSNALKNIVESVKRAAMEKPSHVRYFGMKKDGTTGARLEFSGGFSVMAVHVEGRHV
jgi:hypothetical protein